MRDKMTIQGENYLGGFTEICFHRAFQRFKGPIYSESILESPRKNGLVPKLYLDTVSAYVKRN